MLRATMHPSLLLPERCVDDFLRGLTGGGECASQALPYLSILPSILYTQ
jgi:hypothetical protein